MKEFIREKGLVVPLDRANVDTDAILPKQYLKSIRKTGFGEYCFDEWRYLDHDNVLGEKKERRINPDFVLNYDRYKGASILLTRENFGCGSSREHAPWALIEYGFRAIIAPSFADIFCNNCYKNGLLPVVLNEKIVNELFIEVEKNIGYTLTIDLPKQIVITKDKNEFYFEITEYRKNCLLKGLDEIGLTLLHKDKIELFEEKYYKENPWLIK